ncbi:MAG: aldo/keto reductase [Oscillospiraceae bacterium]|nr:aldo/keto reductase [Oscillospiraceae bacterium]
MIRKEDIFPIGIGTFRIDLNQKEVSMNALMESFKLGQNYIDTSHLYEDGKVMAFLGEFIKKVGRDKLFIETKIEPTVKKITDIEEQVDKYLKIMDIKYVDCLMLHSVIFTKLPLLDTYKEMNKMVELGKAKSLGLSNSNLEQLKEINEHYPISIYEGVYNLECKLNEDIGIIDYCNTNNIIFCAYQPLRRNRTANRNYPLLVELANKYSKAQNQIILNWILKEKGLNLLLKTTTISRINENLEALQFDMNKEDYEKMNSFRAKEFDDIKIDWEGKGGITVDQLANQFE